MRRYAMRSDATVTIHQKFIASITQAGNEGDALNGAEILGMRL
jgi:hypothetical protein